MPHSSRGALTPGLFWHQPGALATRSPRVLAKDSKDCFWPHSTACRTSQDQGSNPGLLHSKQILYCLGYLGSLVFCNIISSAPFNYQKCPSFKDKI